MSTIRWVSRMVFRALEPVKVPKRRLA